MSAPLTVDDARDLASRYLARRARWTEEDAETAFLVVVLNYGDHLTGVSCVGGEWTGIKGDLTPRDGIPLCPNGHPLLEQSTRMRLGLVPE